MALFPPRVSPFAMHSGTTALPDARTLRQTSVCTLTAAPSRTHRRRTEEKNESTNNFYKHSRECNCCNNCSHDSCAKTCLLVSLGNNLTIFPRSLLSNSHHVWVSFFFLAGEVYHLPRMLRAPSMNLRHVSLENENGARL